MENRSKDNLTVINKINEELDNLSRNNKSTLEELKIVEKQLKNKILETPEESNEEVIEINESKIEAFEEKIKNLGKTTREANKILTEVGTIIEGGETCPKCNHSWSLTESEITLEEALQLKIQTNEVLKKITKKIEIFDKKIEELNYLNEELEEKDRKLEKIREDIEKSKRIVEKIKRKIEENDEEKTRLEKKKSKLKAETKESKRLKELESEIVEVENEISLAKEELEKIEKVWNDYNYWKINFVNFKSFMINKVLKTLEGYINYNLSKFKTFLSVNIDGYKTNKDGTLRENITVLVSKDGGESWNKFRRHSGGQRGRINVCGILTLQSLINSSSKSGGLDLLLLDEVFDGLDALGQREIIHTLEAANITTMIISHNNNDVATSNQIWVEHKNKLSRLLSEVEINKKINKKSFEIK